MIARLALSALAIGHLARRDGAGRVFRSYRAHRALQRCNRLLARSDAAREAGDRLMAGRWLARATVALRQAQRIGGAT